MIDPIVAMFVARREALGLTQQQIADIAGVSQSVYSEFESGLSSPNLVRLRKLGEILGIKLEARSDWNCTHCGRLLGGGAGYSSVAGSLICYRPDSTERPDCYRMVTIYKHIFRGCALCSGKDRKTDAQN